MFWGIVREEKRITRFLTHLINALFSWNDLCWEIIIMCDGPRKRKLKARNSLLHRAKAQDPQDGRDAASFPWRHQRPRKSQARTVTNDATTAKTRCRGLADIKFTITQSNANAPGSASGSRLGTAHPVTGASDASRASNWRRKACGEKGEGSALPFSGRGVDVKLRLLKVRMAGRYGKVPWY